MNKEKYIELRDGNNNFYHVHEINDKLVLNAWEIDSIPLDKLAAQRLAGALLSWAWYGELKNIPE
jgi:hypothetical protein